MNNYNPNIHHRRSIRLKGYDYSQEGLYFITLCVQDRIHLFGEIEKGEMILNQYGKIAEENWINTSKIRKNISLGKFIIMPNHIHGIIQIDYKIKENNQEAGLFKSPLNTIGAIIRGYKGATTKQINILRKEGEIIEEKGIDKKGKGKNWEEEKRIDVTGVLQYAPSNALLNASFHSLQINKSIWQRNYYENIIRNERAFYNISQ